MDLRYPAKACDHLSHPRATRLQKGFPENIVVNTDSRELVQTLWATARRYVVCLRFKCGFDFKAVFVSKVVFASKVAVSVATGKRGRQSKHML